MCSFTGRKTMEYAMIEWYGLLRNSQTWRYGQTFTSLQKGPSTKSFIYGALDKVQFSRFGVVDFNLDRNSMSMGTRFQEAMSFNTRIDTFSHFQETAIHRRYCLIAENLAPVDEVSVSDFHNARSFIIKEDELSSFMHMFPRFFVLLFQVQELFQATGFGDSFRFQVSLLISKRSDGQHNTTRKKWEKKSSHPPGIGSDLGFLCIGSADRFLWFLRDSWRLKTCVFCWGFLQVMSSMSSKGGDIRTESITRVVFPFLNKRGLDFLQRINTCNMLKRIGVCPGRPSKLASGTWLVRLRGKKSHVSRKTKHPRVGRNKLNMVCFFQFIRWCFCWNWGENPSKTLMRWKNHVATDLSQCKRWKVTK